MTHPEGGWSILDIQGPEGDPRRLCEVHGPTGRIRIDGHELPPALCQNCGYIFSGLTPGVLSNLSFEFQVHTEDAPVVIGGIEITPCPRCRKGTGKVPQGMWDKLVAAAKALRSGPQEQLKQVQRVIAEAQANPAADIKETADRLEAAAPELAEIAGLLRSQSNRMEMWMILSILLPLIL
jgi:hypothetical protein